jgi:hypothetical protein
MLVRVCLGEHERDGMSAVDVIVVVLLGYAGLGAVFALAFVLRGASTIDESARASNWGFRVFIFPGAAALWPLLLVRWLNVDRRGATS